MSSNIAWICRWRQRVPPKLWLPTYKPTHVAAQKKDCHCHSCENLSRITREYLVTRLPTPRYVPLDVYSLEPVQFSRQNDTTITQLLCKFTTQISSNRNTAYVPYSWSLDYLLGRGDGEVA
jgi:hypothetical protein